MESSSRVRTVVTVMTSSLSVEPAQGVGSTEREDVMTVTTVRTLEEDSMLYDLTGVTKRYTQGRKTVDALAGIDLRIAEGEFLVIQGSTGSGKTTLLQMLGALDR